MNNHYSKSEFPHKQQLNRIARALAQDGYLIRPGTVNGVTVRRVIARSERG